MYKAYINSNSILENDYPSKDKAFFERQWLEHDSIIDKTGEDLYLGKLKKHWVDYLTERKETVKLQEAMNISENKKIISREPLFGLNYNEYDLTLGEYANTIQKDIKANKENYKEEVEDYKSEGHPDQYDKQGKILALNPTTKQDLIKNYYILRAAEFFLQNH